ncbi:hypothetical protein Scep_028740 [Stephania cephalantha]|uniref:Uncharacterized protein n=1 Tax=Stephania cephalantha TaxID=152367 RepID=A0AAP0EER6_9MAGN
MAGRQRGSSSGARMAWRDDDVVRIKENKERSFARHEISKGEFELMTPLKSCADPQSGKGKALQLGDII